MGAPAIPRFPPKRGTQESCCVLYPAKVAQPRKPTYSPLSPRGRACSSLRNLVSPPTYYRCAQKKGKLSGLLFFSSPTPLPPRIASGSCKQSTRHDASNNPPSGCWVEWDGVTRGQGQRWCSRRLGNTAQRGVYIGAGNTGGEGHKGVGCGRGGGGT